MQSINSYTGIQNNFSRSNEAQYLAGSITTSESPPTYVVALADSPPPSYENIYDNDTSKYPVFTLDNYNIEECPDCKNKLVDINFKEHNKTCKETVITVEKPCGTINVKFFTRRKFIEKKGFINFLSTAKKILTQYNILWYKSSIIDQLSIKNNKDILSFNMYNYNNNSSYIDTKHLQYQTIQLRATSKLQLYISISPNKNLDSNNVNISNEFDDIRPRLGKQITNQEKYISTYNRSYTFEIHSYVTPDCSQLVCSCTLSSISTVNMMQNLYYHDKSNVLKSYIDFVEFFTANGFSRHYIAEYGEKIKWKIKVIEKQAIDITDKKYFEIIEKKVMLNKVIKS